MSDEKVSAIEKGAEEESKNAREGPWRKYV